MNEENIEIKVNNSIVSEKNLVKLNELNTLLFQNLFILFTSSLMTQLLFIIPSSYNLRNLLPTIILCLFILITLILIVIKKQPTVKTYLYLIALLIGLVIGI